MKKILYWCLGIAVVIITLYYLQFHVFSGVKSALGKACYKIQVGMDKQTVLNDMEKFNNKNNVTFSQKTNTLIYVTPGLSGDYQCYVYLDEKDKVKDVTRIFD